jgi:hypothetical protein
MPAIHTNDFRNAGPAVDAFPVTPTDVAATVYPAARRLYIGAAGNVQVVTPQGTSVSFVGVPAGTQLDVASIRVAATGTTAASIVALV